MRKTTKLNPKKVETVAALKEKLEKAKTLFITEYRGLTHQQLEQLRRALKKVEAEYIVAKNRLFKLALEKSLPGRQAGKIQISNSKEVTDQLNNPTATLLAFGDEIAAIKELANFIKTAQLPVVKIGIFGGKVTSADEFKKLATLPSREILLSTLAMRLMGPVSGLHYVLRYNLQGLAVAIEGVKSK